MIIDKPFIQALVNEINEEFKLLFVLDVYSEETIMLVKTFIVMYIENKYQIDARQLVGKMILNINGSFDSIINLELVVR